MQSKMKAWFNLSNSSGNRRDSLDCLVCDEPIASAMGEEQNEQDELSQPLHDCYPNLNRAKMKLLCFPFSGGSASIFLNWFKDANAQIDIIPVELSGRGKRFSEPIIRSLQETIDDLFPRLIPYFSQPYCLFGHSLGCLIIYELVQAIVHQNYPPPSHIFLSGSLPPHHHAKTSQIHLLSNQHFLSEIAKMGGMADEFLYNRELQDIFLPILRTDYQIYETYIPPSKKFFFPSDLTILVGNEDQVASPEAAANWQSYTNKKSELIVYEGNHFFIKDNSAEITRLLNQTILQKLCQPILN